MTIEIDQSNNHVDKIVEMLIDQNDPAEELKQRVGDNQVDSATRRKAILTLAKSLDANELFEFLKPHIINNRGLANAVAKALVHCDNRNGGRCYFAAFDSLPPMACWAGFRSSRLQICLDF